MLMPTPQAPPIILVVAPMEALLSKVQGTAQLPLAVGPTPLLVEVIEMERYPLAPRADAIPQAKVAALVFYPMSTLVGHAIAKQLLVGMPAALAPMAVEFPLFVALRPTLVVKDGIEIVVSTVVVRITESNPPTTQSSPGPKNQVTVLIEVANARALLHLLTEMDF